MINRLNNYLAIIDLKLSEMFKQQSPFIKCKIGCAYCCREGDYPVSELEYVNMMMYYNTLPDNLRGVINENIENVISKKRNKYYECPFLVKGVCSIYAARPIICRTFGLISYTESGRKKIPFCVNLGLNYSEVFDEETSKIVKCAKDGTEPCAFNIDRAFLRRKEIEETFNIFFGEDKALIDWLKEENLPDKYFN